MSRGRVAWDAFAWVVAMFAAVLFRYDFRVSSSTMVATAIVGVLLALLQVVLGIVLHLYRGRYRLASFDEVSGVFAIALVIGFIGTTVVVVAQPVGVPRSAPVIAMCFAVLMMLGGRFGLRWYRQRGRYSDTAVATLVYGAGESGDQLTRLIAATPDSEYRPIGYLDDDESKRHLRMNGLPVLGTGADLERIAREHAVGVVVVAIAGIDSAQLLELDRRCTALGVALRVIPTAAEIVGGAVKLGDISDVTEEDLLGRRPVHADERGIAAFLAGKRVLITGAGGSIGSEIARQVHRYGPAYLGLLDRDESALHALQLSIDGRGLLSSDDLILADIRDRERVREVLMQTRPDIMFHAAALKHLPLLERYPDEGHKTNVVGTANVLMAAHEAGVTTLVNISTDKAANPSCVLGHTKLATERLTAGMPADLGTRYMSVRFGNVLGSRGSVLTTFRRQIAEGGPVTVTDPDVTRYFMTIPEAVHLVLQAATIGEHGETMVLDMGRPVRIVDVAQQMIDRSGRSIDIVFTGLRPGEKLHEELVGHDEAAAIRDHPLISHLRVEPMALPGAAASKAE